MNNTHFEPKKRSIEEMVESLRLLGCSEFQAQLHGQRLLKARTAQRPHHVRIDGRPRGPRSWLFHGLKATSVDFSPRVKLDSKWFPFIIDAEAGSLCTPD